MISQLLPDVRVLLEPATRASSMTGTKYTSMIDKLLERATELGFTEQDFAELALVAADQAGGTLDEQARIATVLGIQ